MKISISIILVLLAFVGLTNACENCPGAAGYNWYVSNPNYIALNNSNVINTDQSAFSSEKSDYSRRRVNKWPGEFSIGYNPFVDYLRGNIYGFGGSIMPRQIIRRDDKKVPGDYLNGPTWRSIGAEPFRPDSASLHKLRGYIKNMLQPGYTSDEIIDFITNYKNIWGDSTRSEFFGRFIIDDQRMSLGGWYDKFAVIGLYLPYDDGEGFLSAAKRYFILPDINVDSIRITKQDTLNFYEYLDRDNGFRLRGFRISFGPIDKPIDTYKTMVIEFTKFYDEEFVP